jgi:hypothetical protein
VKLTDVTYHVTLNDSQPVLHLGGFQETADFLSVLSRKKYSRQAVHQLWKRRITNGFPDRKNYLINGYYKLYFDMEEIREWYNEVKKRD